MNRRLAPPRAAYVHVPFCRHHCGYCNFTVVAGRDDLIDSYLKALAIELSWLGHPHEVDSLFLGGGTPSHLPADRLDRLLELVRQWFVPAADCEFTIEANPVDITPDRLALLKERGVNRVSLGVQSFQARKLALLERDHRVPEIERATRLVGQWIGNLALDLMFGVPQESAAEWQADWSAAVAQRPDHISVYGLTIERGSRFYGRVHHGELSVVGEEAERGMYEAAIDGLMAAGYEHYEVSNFARTGRRSRHNEVYWTGGGYFAAGPGASRFVAGRRQTNHRSVFTYLRRVLSGRSPVAEEEELAPEDAARERLVFALRRIEGIDKDDFSAETGYTVDDLGGDALKQYIAMGLLESTPQRLRLDPRRAYWSATPSGRPCCGGSGGQGFTRSRGEGGTPRLQRARNPRLDWSRRSDRKTVRVR